jgi:ABC-type dipeptide/oligopeptide/nickel transport system ATPase component
LSEENWFVKWAKERMGSKRNFLLAIVGETGSGKSYMGLRLGEVLDPNRDFGVSHVVFTPEEFFECLGRLGNNCFIMFDEAGVSYSHREFQSMVNKMLSFVFQTFRYKFINVIFTVPTLGYMDYVGRGLLHAVIRMLDRGRGVVYRVQKNMLGRNIFYPKIGIIETNLPSKGLVDAYEAKKAEVMNVRYKSWETELKVQKSDYRYAPIDVIAKEVMEHLDDFKGRKGKVDAMLISSVLGIGVPKAYMVKRYVEYKLADVKG